MFFKKKNVCLLKLIIVCFLYLVSCTSKTNYDATIVCQEFYSLNKNKDLYSLRNLRILDTREYSVYDTNSERNNRIPLSIGILYESDTIFIPSYAKNADTSERMIFYNRCDSNVLNYIGNKYQTEKKTDSLFKYYQVELDSIYYEYFKVKIPKMLPYNNIPVLGNGGYIEFILLNNNEDRVSYKCFLVVDSLLLNQKDKKRLSKLSRFDDIWYYSIME